MISTVLSTGMYTDYVLSIDLSFNFVILLTKLIKPIYWWILILPPPCKYKTLVLSSIDNTSYTFLLQCLLTV